MAGYRIGTVFNTFRGLSDEAWLDVLVRSMNEPVIDGATMPTFAPDEMQRQIHGVAGTDGLRQAFAFYREVKQYAAFAGRPVDESRMLLDFGCGYGRVLRMFMKDIRPTNLFGVDPQTDYVPVARVCNPELSFICCDIVPPLPLASASLDYVVAWSVFSHLDEYLANVWVDEFTRLLKPGGLVFVSTQGRGFIDFCEGLRARKAGGETFEHEWLEMLSHTFPDAAATRAQFDAGAFLFAPTHNLPPNPAARYGETIISRRYVEDRWTDRFWLIEHLDDGVRLAQAMIVLQKKSRSGRGR